MEKNTTISGKWFFMVAVIVIGMFGTNNHAHQNVNELVPFIKVTPIPQSKLNARPLNVVDPVQLECLAKNIYYEARGESTKGQIAVARVVMNRVRHHAFGNTPCKVINQSNLITVNDAATGEEKRVKVCQFSWVCEPNAPLNKNSAVYQRALHIAKEVLKYDAHADLLPRNTLFFHSVNVNPNWGYRRVAVIGNHVFYAKGK
jgi:spore germination cell wall hydrolase CwlJ-like protein